jgi:hypothetical protein
VLCYPRDRLLPALSEASSTSGHVRSIPAVASWVQQLGSTHRFPVLLCAREDASFPLAAALHRSTELATILLCGWLFVRSKLLQDGTPAAAAKTSSWYEWLSGTTGPSTEEGEVSRKEFVVLLSSGWVLTMTQPINMKDAQILRCFHVLRDVKHWAVERQEQAAGGKVKPHALLFVLHNPNPHASFQEVRLQVGAGGGLEEDLAPWIDLVQKMEVRMRNIVDEGRKKRAAQARLVAAFEAKQTPTPNQPLSPVNELQPAALPKGWQNREVPDQTRESMRPKIKWHNGKPVAYLMPPKPEEPIPTPKKPCGEMVQPKLALQHPKEGPAEKKENGKLGRWHLYFASYQQHNWEQEQYIPNLKALVKLRHLLLQAMRIVQIQRIVGGRVNADWEAEVERLSGESIEDMDKPLSFQWADEVGLQPHKVEQPNPQAIPHVCSNENHCLWDQFVCGLASWETQHHLEPPRRRRREDELTIQVHQLAVLHALIFDDGGLRFQNVTGDDLEFVDPRVLSAMEVRALLCILRPTSIASIARAERSNSGSGPQIVSCRPRSFSGGSVSTRSQWREQLSLQLKQIIAEGNAGSGILDESVLEYITKHLHTIHRQDMEPISTGKHVVTSTSTSTCLENEKSHPDVVLPPEATPAPPVPAPAPVVEFESPAYGGLGDDGWLEDWVEDCGGEGRFAQRIPPSSQSSSRSSSSIPSIEQESTQSMTLEDAPLATHEINGVESSEWNPTLAKVLKCEVGFMALHGFASGEYSNENVEFWAAAASYREMAFSHNTGSIRERAELIYDLFIRRNAELCINLEASVRKAIQERYDGANDTPLDTTLFIEAEEAIFNLMEMDLWPRFLKSEGYMSYKQQHVRAVQLACKQSGGIAISDETFVVAS